MKIFNFLTTICDRPDEPLVVRVFAWGGGGRKKYEMRKKFIINSCHPPPDGVKLSLRIDPDKHATPPGSEIILLPSFLYTCDPAGVKRVNPNLGLDSWKIAYIRTFIEKFDPAGVINLNPNQKILVPQESHMYRERPSLKHSTPLGSSISFRTSKILTPEESNVYRNNPALAPPGPGRVE